MTDFALVIQRLASLICFERADALCFHKLLYTQSGLFTFRFGLYGVKCNIKRAFLFAGKCNRSRVPFRFHYLQLNEGCR